MDSLIAVPQSLASVGVVYTVEHWRKGRLLSSEQVHNIFPTEGMNHILNAVLDNATSFATWYVGIFDTNTTPSLTTTYATPLWTESTDYDESVRETFTSITATASTTNNSASPAAFTMDGTTTIYGAFITNISTRGDTAGGGIMLSAAKFATAKTVDATDVLKVTGTLTLTSS